MTKAKRMKVKTSTTKMKTILIMRITRMMKISDLVKKWMPKMEPRISRTKMILVVTTLRTKNLTIKTRMKMMNLA
jgi:hypothetical protein